MSLESILWTAIAFLAGSIPFSYLVGRLAAHVDIRTYGDRNPGAANVLRATGWGWAALAGLLDYLKGALPVGIAWFGMGIAGWGIVPVALAPLLGHAYSPWLRFRGGKGVAATFGIWSGLTIGAAPLMLGLMLPLMVAVVVVSGWAVVLAMLGLGGFLALQYGAHQPELLVVWLVNLLLLAWRYRHDLRRPPGIRPWLLRLAAGRRSVAVRETRGRL
jgi:glycerol-3-phosphate acyltransferase PlsY